MIPGTGHGILFDAFDVLYQTGLSLYAVALADLDSDVEVHNDQDVLLLECSDRKAAAGLRRSGYPTTAGHQSHDAAQTAEPRDPR